MISDSELESVHNDEHQEVAESVVLLQAKKRYSNMHLSRFLP